LNGATYKTESFPVKFKNPVQPLVVKARTTANWGNKLELIDKEVTADNTSKLDLRRAVQVLDFNGGKIFDFVSPNFVTTSSLLNQYAVGYVGGTETAATLTNVAVVGVYP